MTNATAAAMVAPPRKPGSVAGSVVSGVGVGCAVVALPGFVAAADLGTAMTAVLLHVLATLLVAQGTAMAGATRSEVLLLAAAAAAMPAIGAVAAFWCCLTGAARHASNAHAENDPLRIEPMRNGADLQRELAVNSYTQVVQHGSLEQKRNLLRRLAQLGTARHIAIVRQFLFEEEPELRLCAYAELARIGQRHEQQIGALRLLAAERAAGAPQAAALADLALANRAYAMSGVADTEMAAYWSAQAEGFARQALAADSACVAAQRVLALLLADRGELDAAWQIVADWSADLQPECELVRAEVAFRRRDRSSCRESLARLNAAALAAPEWLRAAAGQEVST